jgi:hypothetical protein
MRTDVDLLVVVQGGIKLTKNFLLFTGVSQITPSDLTLSKKSKLASQDQLASEIKFPSRRARASLTSRARKRKERAASASVSNLASEGAS